MKTTELLEKRGSFSGDAFLTTGYAGDGIAKGQAFELSARITIGGNSTADVWIDYASYTDTSAMPPYFGIRMGVVVILPPFFSATYGPVFIDVYRDPVVESDTGTAIKTIRKNTIIANDPQVEWILNPNVTNTGPDDPFEYLVGTEGRGAVSGGGSSLSGSPFYRSNESSTLVRINNQNSNQIAFYYNQVWYEI